MRKQMIAAFFSLAVLWSPTLGSVVYANPVNSDLSRLITGDQTGIVQNVQQLLAMKQKIDQGDTKAALAALVQEAAGKALAAKATASLPTTTKATTEDTTEVIKNVVQSQLGKSLSDQLGPELNALLQLFGQSTLQPAMALGGDSSAGVPKNYSKVLDITATAYGPGVADNGHWGDNDYYGNPLKMGDVAVDPNLIPMGTKLYIPGYGYGIANDQGGAIKGNRIDLFFPNRQDALDYGIKQVKVYVLS